ncbi:metal-dependent hydrolase [Parvibaculum sp.]|uniref:metal-dependent hydrolase n=1 Tax=Parvibaculum sp. TaxID=2024848 RepID=UPI003C73A600
MSTPRSETPSLSRSEIPFAARNRHFKAGQEKYWYNGDPAVSAYFNALSALFPAGETFFCDSVRALRDRVDDPKLLAEVKEFLAQEAIHSREHHIYNKRITEQGYPMDKLERRSEQMQAMGRLLPKKLQLGLTIALEHYTAIISDCLLDVRGHFAAHVTPTDYEFWIWHCVEETEHKSVAYDLLRAVTSPLGFYFIRVFSLFATTLSFNAILMWHIWTLLKVDGLQWNARAWGRILHYQWVFPGAWRVCFPAWLAWLKPGFHPWQDDNREHVATWKAENGETENASAA